jgi:hypothetical protein
MPHLDDRHNDRSPRSQRAAPPRRARTLLYAHDATTRAWDKRARAGDCVIGVSCPRCWRPVQAPGYRFPSFCQCGEEWDLLETTLAAHGLTTTTLTFHSNPNVYCG